MHFKSCRLLPTFFLQVALGDPSKAKRYPLRCGKDEFRQCLVEKFPDEVPAIDKFLEMLSVSRNSLFSPF